MRLILLANALHGRGDDPVQALGAGWSLPVLNGVQLLVASAALLVPSLL